MFANSLVKLDHLIARYDFHSQDTHMGLYAQLFLKINR